jgi:hypothetical protein
MVEAIPHCQSSCPTLLSYMAAAFTRSHGAGA